MEVTTFYFPNPRALRHLEELPSGHPELYGGIPGLGESLVTYRRAVRIARVANL